MEKGVYSRNLTDEHRIDGHLTGGHLTGGHLTDVHLIVPHMLAPHRRTPHRPAEPKLVEKVTKDGRKLKRYRTFNNRPRRSTNTNANTNRDSVQW